MHSSHLLHLFLLGSSFVLFQANAEEITLKEMFETMEGDLATTRDYCLKDSSITLDDLKLYKDPEQLPENQACFYKCLYIQTKIIGPDGEVDVDALEVLPGLDKSKFGEVKKCVEDFDKVVTCLDMRKIAKCIDLAVTV